MSSITLPPEVMRQIIEDAKKELIAQLLPSFIEELKLLESCEVSAILRLDRRTWSQFIPRITVMPGVYRWRRADVEEFILSRREKMKPTRKAKP